MPDVLIFSAQTGGGHTSLARALQDLLSPLGTATVVEPLPPSMARNYRLMSRHARWMWALGYHATDTRLRAWMLHQVFTRLFARRLDAVLRRNPCHVVLTTYPFFTYELAAALRRLPRPVPLVPLFADPECVHHAWLSMPRAVATLAPTRETYTQALAAGFAPERTHLCGWPLRRQFRQSDLPPRAAILGALGFAPEPFTVFVQGGGEGSAGIARSVEVLQAAGVPQIVLAAGSNAALAERFRAAPNVRALGFAEQIAPLMAAADLVVGKAGPNTLFEAVALGKPFLATTHIPGQEEGNLPFIERHRLGWVALESQAQHQLTQRLLAEPGLLASTARCVQRYRDWNTIANQRIRSVVAELLPSQGQAVGSVL